MATGIGPVALLGPPIEHRDSLTAMIGEEPGAAVWIPDSFTFLQPTGRKGAVRRVLDLFVGTGNSDYLAHVLGTLDQHGCRRLIAYWGTIPLADILAIKKHRPGIKVALMVLCFPVSLSGPGVYRQYFFMRRLVRSRALDGIIYPTVEMQGYFRERVFRGEGPPAVVIPPCWPAGYQSAEQAAPAGPGPNLVYTGRTDLSSRTIHPGDDIRPLMTEVLAAGIQLHHVYSPETDDHHPLRRPFAPLPLPGLIAAMPDYDASLIAYNTAACRRPDRFVLTVPDRLISTVAAGVPVALPRAGYDGAKSYLKQYPAVIEFGTAEELAAVLRDRPRVSALRDAAWRARSGYTAERYGADLRAFIAAV